MDNRVAGSAHKWEWIFFSDESTDEAEIGSLTFTEPEDDEFMTTYSWGNMDSKIGGLETTHSANMQIKNGNVVYEFGSEHPSAEFWSPKDELCINEG